MGLSVIRLTGSLEVESVHIEPSIVDPSDPTLLEDAVLAALQDALGRIVELRSSLQVPAQAGLVGGIDLGGFAGNLDLAGLLTGVDLQGLMGNLGLSPDLGVIGALGAQGKDEDERDADDQIDEEPEA